MRQRASPRKNLSSSHSQNKRRSSWSYSRNQYPSRWRISDNFMRLKKRKTKRENRRLDSHRNDSRRRKQDSDTSNNSRSQSRSKTQPNLKYSLRPWTLGSTQVRRTLTLLCLCFQSIIRIWWITSNSTHHFKNRSLERKRTQWSLFKDLFISWR